MESSRVHANTVLRSGGGDGGGGGGEGDRNSKNITLNLQSS